MTLLSLVTLMPVVPCVALKVPATSILDAGAVVPMPTLELVLSTNKVFMPMDVFPLKDAFPSTSNLFAGDVVPIPTFPELVAR